MPKCEFQRQIVPFAMKAVSEEGAFSGYGSVFGNVDWYGDRVNPGAFKDSLALRMDSEQHPSMLWQHNPDVPIGRWDEMVEDEHGLKVAGRLALKTQAGGEAHELLKFKAVNGLSIGFMVEVSDWNEVDGIRELKKVDLWEVSLVTFPANEMTRVNDVKKKLTSGETLSKRELEALLRDAGLSGTAAKRLLAGGYDALEQRDADVGNLVDSLKNLKSILE